MALMQPPRDKPLHCSSLVVSENMQHAKLYCLGDTCNLRVNGLVVFPLDSLYIRREKSLVFLDSEWCFPSGFSRHGPFSIIIISHATHSLLWLLCGNCLLNGVIQFGVYVNEIHSHMQVQHYPSPPNGRLPAGCVSHIKCTQILAPQVINEFGS